jgi:hypothetical protein
VTLAGRGRRGAAEETGTVAVPGAR